MGAYRAAPGSTDVPLTVHGEAEARELRASLAGIDFAAVLVSPRQRASRTCELAGLGSQAVVEADLVEWDYGSYEGRRTVDIRRERPDWNIFRDGCPHARRVTRPGSGPQRPTHRPSLHARRKCRAFHARPIRLRPGCSVDRIVRGRRPASDVRSSLT
jgi:broad specificity phosphatase PhoE